jgi:hypothetical protein
MEWNTIIERVRAAHNGVFVVELYLGHDGDNVCKFCAYKNHDGHDNVIARGESGRSLQEAVERCCLDWGEQGAELVSTPEPSTEPTYNLGR